MPKLTDAQVACLTVVNKARPGAADWMMFCKAQKAGLAGSCTKGLVARGLISGNKDVGWSMTTAGIAALAAGKY